MDWTGPNAINFGETATAETRLLGLLGHLDLRVRIGAAWVDVGAGSFTTARRITNVPIGYAGPLGRIGRFVEAAECEILFAGEHQNGKPVNAVFMNVPALWGAAAQAGMVALHKPIDIGSGVVISQGARILSGAGVGDGVVIGAGAVVTKRLEPFGVYGGVPARRIGSRFAPDVEAQVAVARWWDLDVRTLFERMGELQRLAVASGPLAWRPERPRYVVSIGAVPGGQVVGFVDGEVERPLAEAPPRARDYALQLSKTGPAYWLADPWMT